MKLELKHLAPYLPYRLQMEILDFPLNKVLGKHYRFLELDCGHDFHFYFSQNRVRPVLRPILEFGDSDDTRKVHQFIGLGKWCEAYDCYFDAWFNDLSNVDKLVLQAPQEIFNYFLANHFDVFGLIKNDLAISIHDVEQADA